MENKPSDLRESLWRRKPTDAGRAELRAQPELELEARLTDALGQIPGAVVSSNFTARVLAAIELQEAQEARSRSWTLNWRALLPRVAVAAAVLVFAGVSFQRYEAGLHRAKISESLALVASAKAVPSMDALNNFDAIQRMSQPRANEELLALLQ